MGSAILHIPPFIIIIISPVETEASDITNLYHGLCGHNNASLSVFFLEIAKSHCVQKRSDTSAKALRS